MGLAQINIRFKADLKQFSTEMQNVGREMEKIGSKMQTIGATMTAAITLPLVAMGAAAYNMAADFEDALGATNQVFKDAADSTMNWANALPTYYGIAKKEALEYSNMMGSMLQNIGNLTEQEASQQSAKLIELAGDLTAMYGGTTADAVRALTGALKGNNTMLDNYGMAANDAMVKTKAMEMGLISQGETMSLSAKQAATLALIYEQSAAAQGQAAREADGASGSMRALKTELTNVATEFGQHLLPIITPVVQGLRDMMERFRDLDPAMKQVIVIVAAVLAAVGPLIAIFGTFAAVLPSIIAGLSTMGAAFTAMTGPVGLVIAGVAALIALIVANWDEVKKTLADTANYWIDLYNESMLFRAAVETVIGVFKAMGNVARLVFNLLGTLLSNLWNNFKTVFGNLGDLFKAVLTGNFSEIPNIVARTFKETLGDSRQALLNFGKDFSAFNQDMKKTANETLANIFKGKREKLVVEADASKVKKDVTTATVNGLNDGVDLFNKDGKKVKIEVEPAQGSVGFYDKIISELEKVQKNSSIDNETFQVFQQKIDEYKKLRDAITGDLKQEIVVGSEAWYQQEIDGLNKLIPNLEAGSEACFNLVKQREILQKTLEMAQTIPTPVMPEPEQDTPDWYKYHIELLKKARDEAGLTFEELKRINQEINILETTFKMEVEGGETIDVVKEKLDRMKEIASVVSKGLNDAFSSMADSIVKNFGEASNGLERFAQSMYKTVLKLIAMAMASAIAYAIEAGSLSSLGTGVAAAFTSPAFIAAAVGGVMAAFSAIPKFANGGIVSGPTLGLMGEYTGARNNPEVIAPLNKLKDLITPAASNDQPINVVLDGGFSLSGETLQLVLNRVERRKFRTG